MRRRRRSGATSGRIAKSKSISTLTFSKGSCGLSIMKSEETTASSSVPSAVSSNSSASAASVTAERSRILLVDDDDLFRESLGLNLIDEGYEVINFSSGPPVLDYFATGGQADVVLLDWRMPEMNGLEVLRALRRSGSTIPVI